MLNFERNVCMHLVVRVPSTYLLFMNAYDVKFPWMTLCISFCQVLWNKREKLYMDIMQTSDSSQYGVVENSPYRIPYDRHAEDVDVGASWYFSRKEIEENSLSRRDGIDLKKESYLRKSYCTYLQELGVRLKV
jgi:hypothetical protein